MSRNQRARTIALGENGVVRKSEDVWLVMSQTDNSNKQYQVINWGDRYTCNCQDFRIRGRKENCKHIKALQYLLLKNKYGDLIE
jgi:predicted nucleic acid-binding Zn finger protein|tara:strand:- start:530 stop:781 length:252 start_codon:yes stop_codon:yes gene_type:complete